MFYLLSFKKYLFTYLLWGWVYMPECTCDDQKTTGANQFPHSIIRILEVRLSLSGLAERTFNCLAISVVPILLFETRVSLCSQCCPGTCYVLMFASKSGKFTFLSLSSSEIATVSYCVWQHSNLDIYEIKFWLFTSLHKPTSLSGIPPE